MKGALDQLEVLEKESYFLGTGLNDRKRRDMGMEPFVAIDPRICHEVDDAIRVKNRRQGGFLVEIAIADAGQIEPHSRLFNLAVEGGKSRYDPDTGKLLFGILPRVLIKALELKGRFPRNALIISQSFSPEAEPDGPPDIYPGTIVVTNMRQRHFGRNHMRQLGLYGAKDDPLIAFDEAHRRRHCLPYSLPEVLGGKALPKNFAKDVVRTFMDITSENAALFAQSEDIPVLGRRILPDRWIYVPEPEARTHATSPLRRAADIIYHLQVGYHLAGLELPFSVDDLGSFAQDLNITCAPPQPAISAAL